MAPQWWGISSGHSADPRALRAASPALHLDISGDPREAQEGAGRAFTRAVNRQTRAAKINPSRGFRCTTPLSRPLCYHRVTGRQARDRLVIFVDLLEQLPLFILLGRLIITSEDHQDRLEKVHLPGHPPGPTEGSGPRAPDPGHRPRTVQYSKHSDQSSRHRRPRDAYGPRYLFRLHTRPWGIFSSSINCRWGLKVSLNGGGVGVGESFVQSSLLSSYSFDSTYLESHELKSLLYSFVTSQNG